MQSQPADSDTEFIRTTRSEHIILRIEGIITMMNQGGDIGTRATKVDIAPALRITQHRLDDLLDERHINPASMPKTSGFCLPSLARNASDHI
jgi:hypothetical protein